MSREGDLRRIESALRSSHEVLREYLDQDLEVEWKGADSPVTEADRRVDALLKEALLQPGEGWLSEETVDSKERLNKERVWIVDPLDGTKEFIKKIPEWSVSIGLIEDGVPVAGGICNPATNEFVVGSRETGVVYNGQPVADKPFGEIGDARVLASRSEVGRGQWKDFEPHAYEVVPVGSVAYKLGLVAAAQADATWTFVPKNEWDVAGGAALVLAAGGYICSPRKQPVSFNSADPLLEGFVALSKTSRQAFESALEPHWR